MTDDLTLPLRDRWSTTNSSCPFTELVENNSTFVHDQTQTHLCHVSSRCPSTIRATQSSLLIDHFLIKKLTIKAHCNCLLSSILDKTHQNCLECLLHRIMSSSSNLLFLIKSPLVPSLVNRSDQIFHWPDLIQFHKRREKKNLLVSYLQPKNQKICCLLYVAKDVLLSWCRCITWRLCDLMEVVFWMKKVIFLKSSDEEAFRVKL